MTFHGPSGWVLEIFWLIGKIYSHELYNEGL